MDVLSDIINKSNDSGENILDGGYIDDVSGLVMCSKCNGKRQCRINFMGMQLVVRCKCECEIRAYEEEQRRQAEAERMINIKRLKSAGLQDKNFANYRFENCDPEHDKCIYAKRYVDNFDEMCRNGQGMLFWGNVGTGKTFLAACIANDLLENNVPVLMTNFSKLINEIGGLYGEERNQYIKGLKNYRLLIIDDLGVERDSQYVLELVYSVIDERYKSGLPMIITTNITLETLSNPPDIEHARIYDRILERCMPVCFDGRNYRKENCELNRKKTRAILTGDVYDSREK